MRIAWVHLACALLLSFPLASSGDVIGKSAVALDSSQASTRANTFGCIVTDALRYVTKADVALLNASAFKETTLPPGDVDADALKAMLVFPDDKVVVMKLDGKRLRQALEHALSLFPARHSGFLQVSGMKITFDPKAPAGKRIVDLKIAGKGAWKPDATYTVATTLPLAKGGSGFFGIFAAKDIVQRTQLAVLEALFRYVRSHSNLNVTPQERIRSL